MVLFYVSLLQLTCAWRHGVVGVWIHACRLSMAYELRRHRRDARDTQACVTTRAGASTVSPTSTRTRRQRWPAAPRPEDCCRHTSTIQESWLMQLARVQGDVGRRCETHVNYHSRARQRRLAKPYQS